MKRNRRNRPSRDLTSSKRLQLGFVAMICLFQTSSLSSQERKTEVNDMKNIGLLPDLYGIWNYSSPAETREKFIEILPKAQESGDTSYLLQLQTQIARTYSLESKFDSAHEILDEVESKVTESFPLANIRYLLERGRAFNSAGDKQKALALFNDAYSLSKERREDFYAVDAAHMLAIATPEPADKEKWNLIGVKIAERSNNKQTKNWLGSLYNNIGWDYFEQKRFPEALMKFEEGLEYQKVRGDASRINIARWCVAKGYRFVNRIDEALVIQEKLLNENEQSGSPDGYVFEELGELYLLKKDEKNSQKYFAEAYEELSKDNWLVKNESVRLERLKKLGGIRDGSK